MASPMVEGSFGTVKGYRNWYKLVPSASHLEVFVVDFETYIFQEEEDLEGKVEKTETTGIMVYFLVEGEGGLVKCRAFLEKRPYFYLLPKKGVNAGRLAARVKSLDERSILEVTVEKKYDMGELTFPSLKNFVKVVVRTPLDVPRLRDQLERLEEVEEWREADVQFHHRCAIDSGIRVGKWYRFTIRRGRIVRIEESERKEAPEFKVLCYDIEVDMEPTRDPNPDKDPISLIAVYTNDENYVLINEEAVTDTSEVSDFYVLLRKPDETHPLPWVDWIAVKDFTEEMEEQIVQKVYTRTIIFKKESEMLSWFFQFIDEYKPDIFADFYGDRFDIPFLIHRGRMFGMDWLSKSGFKIEPKMEARDKAFHELDLLRDVDYVASVGMFHVDAFLWTQKYSYLPKKDIALKNAVKKRLKIIPIGREALWAMRESPLEGIAYAGSDGYITYRFVKELVLDFCIAMGQMFPVPTAEILTKRAGSLDDLLIDSIAYQRNIVAIKRYQQSGIGPFTKNLVIKNVAYTGGLVEARNPGIWRKDLKYPIQVKVEKLNRLLEIIPKIMKKEAERVLEDARNDYFEQQVTEKLFDDYQSTRGYEEELEELEARIVRELPPEEQQRALRVLDQIVQETRSLTIVNLDEEIRSKVDAIKSLKSLFQEKKEHFLHLQGIHVDVTSMYPSQIRQYKIQPSGIVHPRVCESCKFRESDDSCMLDGRWTLKISLGKPCQYKQRDDGYCQKYRRMCSFKDEEEDDCEGYDPGLLGDMKAQEIFTYDEQRKIEEAYLVENGKLRKIPFKKSFFGSGLPSRESPVSLIANWVEKHVPGTTLDFALGESELEVADIDLPENAFLFIDVRSKNITALISVKSRVCQKAYDFVSAIMNDFFQKRVFHKKEAKRLKKYINNLKKSGKPVPEKILALQKFHDATQLGLKVPLNSIYGLLGMKGGVRNASAPSAGITTAFSASLIKWTADYLEDFAVITELDTDGIWMFLPEMFPLSYSLRVASKTKQSSSKENADVGGLQTYRVVEFGLLEQILNFEVDLHRRNENYWVNDLTTPPRRETRSLLKFEQDGPYDMMLVMGKKKYVVYNRKSDGTWKEEELTGLETKRQDFSQLIKAFQEQLIHGYLELWEETDSLEEVYKNVVARSLEFYRRMVSGELDIEYYVKPKAINKPPEEYKSLQPHVACAYILKELGYAIEPGMRIDMLQIKSGSGKKSDAAIPVQLFEFDIDTIRRVLSRKGISTLAFMMGNVRDKKSLLRNILDMKEYVSNLFDPGRLFDRMVIRLMISQKVSIMLPKELPNASFYQKLLPRSVVQLRKQSASKETKQIIGRPFGEQRKNKSNTVAETGVLPSSTSNRRSVSSSTSQGAGLRSPETASLKSSKLVNRSTDISSPGSSENQKHLLSANEGQEISNTNVRRSISVEDGTRTGAHGGGMMHKNARSTGLTAFFGASGSLSRKKSSEDEPVQLDVMPTTKSLSSTFQQGDAAEIQEVTSASRSGKLNPTSSAKKKLKASSRGSSESEEESSRENAIVTLLAFTEKISGSQKERSESSSSSSEESPKEKELTRKFTDLRMFFSVVE